MNNPRIISVGINETKVFKAILDGILSIKSPPSTTATGKPTAKPGITPQAQPGCWALSSPHLSFPVHNSRYSASPLSGQTVIILGCGKTLNKIAKIKKLI